MAQCVSNNYTVNGDIVIAQRAANLSLHAVRALFTLSQFDASAAEQRCLSLLARQRQIADLSELQSMQILVALGEGQMEKTVTVPW